jgi:hypothetical protein
MYYLCIALLIGWLMNMDQLADWELAKETKVRGINLLQCQFGHHIFCMTLSGTEPGLLLWEAGNYTVHVISKENRQFWKLVISFNNNPVSLNVLIFMTVWIDLLSGTVTFWSLCQNLLIFLHNHFPCWYNTQTPVAAVCNSQAVFWH